MITKYDASWAEFLTVERLDMLKKIEEQIGADYTPKKENILRFLKQDLNEKKVIWLGQDPYFQPEVANGRSFQPDSLNRWDDKFKQVSLKNIIRLVHKSYFKFEHYEEIASYKEIVKQISTGEFPIKQPKEWFDSLERQGVLFLNTSFTCTVNEPNSHKDIWKEFSRELLAYIDEKRPDMIWFLWGKEAIKNVEFLKNGVRYESRHPMMCSSKYDDDFLKSKCFLNTFDRINWLG
ncbi:uracil-DNA glycosylase, family 1 [Lachnospiraceae bacterium KM106-2]|nr:uracil-DNA glycosylase, family 1 [Lachnospiraceae bacterium KM106-2]